MGFSINHAELTVPRGTLTDEAWCADLDRMLIDIFEWSNGMTIQIPHPHTGVLEVARSYRIDDAQMFVLHEHDDYLKGGADAHLGIHVETQEQFYEVFDKCKALADKDDRVEFLMLQDDGQPTHEGTDQLGALGFYVKYLLPLWIDVQTYIGAPTMSGVSDTLFAAVSDGGVFQRDT